MNKVNHLEVLDKVFGSVDELTDSEFDDVWARRAFEPHVANDVIQEWLNECECGRYHYASDFVEFIEQGCLRCSVTTDDGEVVTNRPVQVAFMKGEDGIYAMCMNCYWDWQECKEPAEEHNHKECPLVGETNIMYM